MPTTFDYCLRNGILGVGWRVDIESTNIWESYYQAASQLHGGVQACAYIKRWVSEGDLAWTRDTQGSYFIARVTSGWEYLTTPEEQQKDIDIANVFRCEIKPVPIDAVPGKVVACFRASRTIQEVACPSAREYSKHLWNELAAAPVYKIDYSLCQDIFMLLDDQETEDVIFLFLQSCGWYVVPNTRKNDTMAFEYLVVNPKTAEMAAVQVKTGGTVLDRSDYAQWPMKAFLFQANNLYAGDQHPNVTTFDPQEIKTFLSNAKAWLPEVIRKKLSLVETYRSLTN